MVKEKTERNVQIYQMITAGMPQSAVARHCGITRSAVWQIFKRYAAEYGWEKETEILDPVRIDLNMKKDILIADSKRLKTSLATIIRLAISQSIKRGEFPQKNTLWKGGLTEKTPDVRITPSQLDFIATTIKETGYTKSQVVRLIIENYQPIEIDFQA